MKIPSNSEYLFRNIRKNYSMKFASLNVVNSDFPMYQILDFQCSILAKSNVADSRFPMFQIRTPQCGRFGSIDHIRQRKATQNQKLRCLDAETFAKSLSVTNLIKPSSKTMNNKEQ